MITGRMYKTEGQAHAAVDELRGYGIGEDRIVLLSPGSDVDGAVREMPTVQAAACRLGVERGNYVVAVDPYFGEGQSVERILDRHDPVGGSALPAVTPSNPAPFSDLIGFPPLSDRGRSYFSAAFPELSRPHSFFSSKFGMKLLKERKGSFTSSFGLPLLKQSPEKKSTFGMALLTKSKRR